MTEALPFAPVFDAYFAAYARQDAKGCAAAFTQNARLVSQFGPVLQGRDAIAATHLEWFEEGEENKTWGIIDADVSGDLGHCLTWFEADVPGQDGSDAPDRARGHSLSVLIREAQGGWKIRVLSLTMLDS